MRFTARLVLGTIGILLFSVVILIWAFRSSLQRDLEQSLARTLEREANLVRDELHQSSPTGERIMGRMGRERGYRVTLVDPSGTALADTRQGAAELAGAPEIEQARQGRVGVVRSNDEAGRPQLVVAVPGDPIVRVATDLSAVEGVVREAQNAMLWAALLALLVGSGVAFVAGRSVARPLRELAATARGIPAGHPARLPRSSVPEIEEMVRALRETGSELAARFEAVGHGRAESAALVEAMVEGVLATDQRGRIVTANPGARRLLGYGAEEPLPDLPHLFRVKAAREVVEATRRGEVVQDRELELGERVVSVSSRPLATGGALLVLHDLTRLRHLEAVRRDFVANVSHELKTPLTSIAGYAETLLTDDTDPETRHRFLQTVLANARRMQQLVEDQLSLARIEGGRWQPQVESLEVATAVQNAWAPRTDQAQAAGVEFDTEVQPGAEMLDADPQAVEQILGNLFDNAIRFTPSGGRIICAAEAVDGGVLLSVSDTGSGIASEHLPRIFERYYRVDPARARSGERGGGGTGLGLAIVKHLVEAHGGRVRAVSELGQGTTIGCWFPKQT